MKAICETKKNDVRDAVRAMKENGYKGSIFQIAKATYAHLVENRPEVPENTESRICWHVIDVDKGMLHKKSCKEKMSGNVVDASIVRPDTTGLKMCKKCMKKK